MKNHPIIMRIFLWTALYFIISLCWVGAEYVFEGTVHTSTVDGAIAGLLAFEYMQGVEEFEKR